MISSAGLPCDMSCKLHFPSSLKFLLPVFTRLIQLPKRIAVADSRIYFLDLFLGIFGQNENEKGREKPFIFPFTIFGKILLTISFSSIELTLEMYVSISITTGPPARKRKGKVINTDL